MKTLYLIRHAKSSWKHDHLSDIDRPLNKRGERNAPDMGHRLKSLDIMPDLMISSPANRAHTTCKIISDVLSYPANDIIINDHIYHGSETALLQVVHRIDDQYNVVFLYGHNPGFTAFANSLTLSSLWNIPTCGVFGCTFEVDQWGDVQLGKGKKIFYDFPKNINI